MGKSAPTRFDRIRPVHPHCWLWEPLQNDPTFVLRSMFGTKAAYLDGKLVLCFSARAEPWCGVLIGTEREHHASLKAEFPEIAAHPILQKWLDLPESANGFERAAVQLVSLARRRDPRIGVTPQPKWSRVRARPSRQSRP